MVHLLLLTHGQLGHELVSVAEMILEKKLPITVIGLEWAQPNQEKSIFLRTLFDTLDAKDQVIALTDSFGGTPSNLILGYLKPGKVEIITGVNLAMLLFLGSADLSEKLSSTCVATKQAGQDAIIVAGEFL